MKFSIATHSDFSREYSKRGATAPREEHVDGNPLSSTTILTGDGEMTCPHPNCGWTGPRREYWRSHEKEHR